MDRVTAAAVFNRICELGSLSAAGISRPMVSRYLEEIEKWAGARLIHRLSRHLSITPAGECVLQKTRQLMRLSDEIDEQSACSMPAGTLRVVCAHFTASHMIGPLLSSFLTRYLALRIELEIGSQPVNLVSERIDVAIRITNNPEPGMIARRLGECVWVLCASPDYLRVRGTPQTPDDLHHHNCLHYSNFAGQTWHFLNGAEKPVSVPVTGNFSAGMSSVLCDAAVHAPAYWYSFCYLFVIPVDLFPGA